MHESLEIFETLLGYPPFCNTPVILLLNKADVFRKKITYHSLADYFPQYEGVCEHCNDCTCCFHIHSPIGRVRIKLSLGMEIQLQS